MLYKSSLLTLETIGYSLDIYIVMSIVSWAQEAVLLMLGLYWIVWDRYMQVLYLGRALRTKKTLPDFLKWRRVTRHLLVFRGLTGSQQTPWFWGVTAWYQRLGIRIPRELGFGYPSPLGGLMWSIGIWKLID